MKNVTAGANPMVLRKGIQSAVDAAVDAVINNSKKVTCSDDIARVATVSASDEFIGKLIAEAMEKVAPTASSPLRRARPPRPIPRLSRA